MNARFDMSAILDVLRSRLQDQVGDGFLIGRVLELSPLMTEAVISDRATNQTFCGRFYRVKPGEVGAVQRLWQEHAGPLLDPPPQLPQPSFGLKILGKVPAHLAAEVAGMDVASYLTIIKRCRPEFAVRLAANLVKLLEPLEAEGCHHHRLSPAQVILTNDGFAILRNSGLAGFEQALATHLQLDELTDPTYLAPEQLEGDSAGSATDIYQLGLLLFEMVTGQPPFTGTPKQIREGHLKQGLPNPKSLNPQVGIGLTRVLVKALAKNPEHRFPDLAHFKQALGFMLPPLERHELNGQGIMRHDEFKPSERQRVVEQLAQAKKLVEQKKPRAALQTVEAVLMASGPHERAVAFFRKIREMVYTAPIQKALKEAEQHQQQQQYDRALRGLNLLLGLEPHQQEALNLQTAIFNALADRPLGLQRAIPQKAFLGKAAEAKSLGNGPLAAGLWAQILLAPGSKDPNEPSFEKKMAAREWEALAAGGGRTASLEETPAEEETVPAIASPVAETPSEPVPGTKRGSGWAKLKMAAVVLLGGALLAVLAVILVGKFRRAAQFNEEAGRAYDAADTLEASGQWEAALMAWTDVIVKFPDFKDSEIRQKTLKYKIQNRAQQLQSHLANARNLLDQGVLVDEEGDSATAHLNQALEIDPDNEAAMALYEEIRIGELERAKNLWDQKKVLEAKGVYEQLLAINPDFADPEFGGIIETWTQEKVIQPGLAKLDRAIRRKRWDQAFEISEELEPYFHKADHPVKQRWEQVFQDYQDAYRQAESKRNEEKMLAALQLMTRIRPHDQALAEQRNKLNRDLNLSKILKMEKDINRALDRDQFRRAGQLANQLRRLDSENRVAENALATVRKRLKAHIDREKNGNPRIALAAYDDLISVLNWKSFRTEREQLNRKISQFDRKVNQIKQQKATSFEDRKRTIDDLMVTHRDFSRDEQYQWLERHREKLIREHQRFQAFLKWEAEVRDDVRLSYAAILDKIAKTPAFPMTYAQQKVQELKNGYQDRIQHYQGNVTLVIRSARNLPKESSGLNRAPEAFCELTTGGRTFRTGVVSNNHHPTWDYTCNLNAQSRQPLVFNVYDEDNRKRELLGSLEIPGVPPNRKELVLKHPDGWSLTLDIRRER